MKRSILETAIAISDLGLEIPWTPSELFLASAIKCRVHWWHFAELDHAAAVGCVGENAGPIDQVL